MIELASRLKKNAAEVVHQVPNQEGQFTVQAEENDYRVKADDAFVHFKCSCQAADCTLKMPLKMS